MPPGFGTTGQPLQRAGPPMPPGFQQRPSPNFTATAQQFVGMQSYSAPAGPIIPAKMRTEALAAAAAMANPAPKPDAAAEGEGGVDADQKKKPKPNRMAAGRKWHDPDMDAFEKGPRRWLVHAPPPPHTAYKATVACLPITPASHRAAGLP